MDWMECMDKPIHSIQLCFRIILAWQPQEIRNSLAMAAKVTAKELRASGVRWNFAPVLDIGRQPLWSRFPETYGEDVYIGKTMGAAAIKAYEEDGLKNPNRCSQLHETLSWLFRIKKRQRPHTGLYTGN